MGDKVDGPIWAEDCKSVCFNELGEGDDDTWLEGSAQAQAIPHQKRNIHESACPPIASLN